MDVSKYKTQIEEYKRESERILRKILQGFSIKRKIEEKKESAILLLQENINNQKALAILRDYLEKDRWLLRIIIPGIEKGIKILEDIKKMEEELNFNKKFIIHIGGLIDILLWIERYTKDINKRVKLEERFLKSVNMRRFLKFLRQWEKGHEIVYGIIKKRADSSFLRKVLSLLFYKILNLSIS